MTNLWSVAAGLIDRHWEVIDVVLVTAGLFIYVGASHGLHQRRHPSAAIAWVLGIILVPFVTLPLSTWLSAAARSLPRQCQWGSPGI
jgi:cardiolipin synthase